MGGGLLGLECAKALLDLGLQTHVVEFAPRLMAVQVDDPGARVLRARIEELGVSPFVPEPAGSPSAPDPSGGGQEIRG